VRRAERYPHLIYLCCHVIEHEHHRLGVRAEL
jgi:hypothetical protein